MSHLTDFAVHHLQRGPMTTGAIRAVFTNMGNHVKGDGPDEQDATIEAALAADERVAQHKETKQWWLKPPEDKADEG